MRVIYFAWRVYKVFGVKYVHTVAVFNISAAAAACDSTSSEQRCDSACQTDNVVSCCCAAETNSLRCQLRAVRQQLARCQTMLAKMRVQVGRHKKMEQNLEKLTNRGRLVLDQCVMKGNAKSAKAVR